MAGMKGFYVGFGVLVVGGAGVLLVAMGREAAELPSGPIDVAAIETGVAPAYLARAWQTYTDEAIFPRDGDASTAAVQALIEVSALIRALPNRRHSEADRYIGVDERHGVGCRRRRLVEPVDPQGAAPFLQRALGRRGQRVNVRARMVAVARTGR